MKALAVDSAVSKLTISAKNDDKCCTTIFDIGMKQSETIVNAIDYVLNKVNLSASELEYLALTSGPGSFTGLRLAFSALKAIELAFNIPLYGFSSLQVYAAPYFDYDCSILSCIDANKNRFYARLCDINTVTLEDGDYNVDDIILKLQDFRKVLICGPDNYKLKDKILSVNPTIKIICPKTQSVTTDIMFNMLEDCIKKGTAPLKNFDGPVYLRASEAEIVHAQKTE